MRVAVVSDIHANMEAFQQVLNDIDASDIDVAVNLGDSIGYGPDPEAVLAAIRARGIPDILGNHEKAIIDKIYRRYSMAGARKSIQHTVNFLSPNQVAYIRKLPKFRVIDDARFVHGCPPQSTTIYLNHLTLSELENAFGSFEERICFAGHTHRLMLISYDGQTIDFDPFKGHVFPLDPRQKHIVNVGSVGQHRDGDPRAKYVIWDIEGNYIEIRRIDYDIEATAARIIERGFLKEDADRLF